MTSSAGNSFSSAHTASAGRHHHARSNFKAYDVLSDIRERAVLVQGEVARDSNIASNLANKRYAVLYDATSVCPPILATYRRREDELPSKTWPITSQAQLTEVEEREMRLRDKGTSTLYAVAAGAYTVLDMFCFTITFGYDSLWGQDKLTLCFENAEVAVTWHAKLAGAIAEQPEGEEEGPSAHAGNGTLRQSAADLAAAAPRPVATKQAAAAPPGRGAPAGGEDGGYSAGEQQRVSRMWQSVRHINGVAVYAEEETPDGEGGAVMMSSVVRSTPHECFRAMVSATQRQSDVNHVSLFNASTLEVLDRQTSVISTTWKPSGALASALCAPRQLVLLRSWRQDADGTYIVLYQSTNHRRAAAEAARRGGGAPVRAHVHAAGVTISPLLPRYTGGAASQECLVTCVVKLDFGGWLARGGALARWLPAVSDVLQGAWLVPMVTSLMMLRDRVEQARFVVRPYSMAAEVEEEEEEPDSPALGSPRLLSRTTTRLVAGRQRAALGPPAPRGAPAAEQGAGAEEDEAPAPAASAAPSAAVAAAAPQAPPPVAAVSCPGEEAWALGGTCPSRFWSCPGAADLRVRGKNYLVDRKKVPTPPPMFDLHCCDLLELEDPTYHIARYLTSIKHSPHAFNFILQLMIPARAPLSLTMCWSAPLNPETAPLEQLCAAWEEDDAGTVRAFFTNLQEWMRGDTPDDDARRSRKFKLIPHILRGSWIVKQSVGTTPVLLGQKLTTKYFRGRTAGGGEYFEVDVDITSNTVANSVTSLVVGAITSLVVDLAPLIEGQAEEELPERLLGSVRFDHLDLKTAAYLDDESGRLCRNAGAP